MNRNGMNPWIAKWYQENADGARALMHDIWLHPELGLHEYHAAQAAAD